MKQVNWSILAERKTSLWLKTSGLFVTRECPGRLWDLDFHPGTEKEKPSHRPAPLPWAPGTQGREAACSFTYLPFHPLGAELWVQVGEEGEGGADVSLYTWVQPWPSGLDACYSSSSSAVWGRTVAAPACQVERDSCPNIKPRALKVFWQIRKKIPAEPWWWLSYDVPLMQTPLCPLFGGSQGCAPTT